MSLTEPAAAGPLSQQLLDAQVAYHLNRLEDDELGLTIAGLAEEMLAASGKTALADLIEPDAIKDIVSRALGTVPGSAAVSGFVDLAADVVYAGPAEAYPLGDLVDRAQLEAVLDEVFALNPVLERALEQLTTSPLVGTMASRFMGRIVGEVVQANNAVANKMMPGLGSLMSFGTSTAAKAMGAADKQLEGLLGETVGKGGSFAVRRLNRILIETLRDPTTRDAVLQVWDLVAAKPVSGLAGQITREELSALTGTAHNLVVSTLADEHITDLVHAVVDAFFDRFGGLTTLEMLTELDLAPDDLVADLVRLAPGVVGSMRDSGDLERIIRAQLEPFYASSEVASLLG